MGHIVVRPADAGSRRAPKSAKKMALMSSDLPRENSATSATISLSSLQPVQHPVEREVDLRVREILLRAATRCRSETPSTRRLRQSP